MRISTSSSKTFTSRASAVTLGHIAFAINTTHTQKKIVVVSLYFYTLFIHARCVAVDDDMTMRGQSNVRISYWIARAISCDTAIVSVAVSVCTDFRNRQIGNKITHRSCDTHFDTANKSCDRTIFSPIFCWLSFRNGFLWGSQFLNRTHLHCCSQIWRFVSMKNVVRSIILTLPKKLFWALFFQK